MLPAASLPFLSSGRSIGMTLVTVRTVVDVTRNSLVMGVGRRLGVAIGAHEHRKVRWIRMTGSAHAVCAPMVRGEPGVVERGSQPRGRGVAGLAARRKSCCHMIGIGRAPVILLMTAVAGRGQRGVVVVHVTAAARHAGVRSRQGEWRVVVIKRRAAP